MGNMGARPAAPSESNSIMKNRFGTNRTNPKTTTCSDNCTVHIGRLSARPIFALGRSLPAVAITRLIVKASLAVFICFYCAQFARGATYGTDGSSTGVQLAINLAANGDTVTIPAGTFTWTHGVSCKVDVTLMGAGTSATGVGDQTVIIDNYAANQPLMSFQTSSTGVFRMTGITVKSGTGTIKDGGTITISGPGNVRIDHCHLIASSVSNYKMVDCYSGVFGVLDHCILDFTGTNALYFANGRLGSGDQQGNYEWSLTTNFGGSDYFFIEDNIINGNVASGAYSTRVWDGWTASKVVVRFNTVSQAVLSEEHATGHSPDDRGVRSEEIYGNKVTSSLAHDPNYAAVDLSSGTALVWRNRWDQVYETIYGS